MNGTLSTRPMGMGFMAHGRSQHEGKERNTLSFSNITFTLVSPSLSLGHLESLPSHRESSPAADEPKKQPNHHHSLISSPSLHPQPSFLLIINQNPYFTPNIKIIEHFKCKLNATDPWNQSATLWVLFSSAWATTWYQESTEKKKKWRSSCLPTRRRSSLVRVAKQDEGEDKRRPEERFQCSGKSISSIPYF